MISFGPYVICRGQGRSCCSKSILGRAVGVKFISRNGQSTRKDKDASLSCQNGITINVDQGAISSGTASQGADQEREYQPTKGIMEASQRDKDFGFFP